MKSEEDIKKILDEWDKSLTADMKRYWNKNENNLEQRLRDSDMHSRFWFAHDIVRHIRAKILELDNY